MVEASAYFSHSHCPSLLEELIGMMKSGFFFWKGYKGLRSSRELKETMLCIGRKALPGWHEEEEQLVSVHKLSQAEKKRKAVWKRWLTWGSTNICGSTLHLALIPPYGERQPVIQFGF